MGLIFAVEPISPSGPYVQGQACDNTACRARREFRGKFEYQLSRPRLLETELEQCYF